MVVKKPNGDNPTSASQARKAWLAGEPFVVIDPFHHLSGEIVTKADTQPPVTIEYGTEKRTITIWSWS